MYQTIRIDTVKGGVTTLTLDRAEVHNAFDEVMISELRDAFQALAEDTATRVIVIRAEGKSFCAGADLNWMKRAAGFSEAENYDDAMKLAELLHGLDALPKPTVAFVQGPVFGGGVGLISCCDIVVAARKAIFCLSEVKLGLVPAVISPYVVRAIGVRAARRYFQSAERFDCDEAFRIGLVHEIAASHDRLDDIVASLLQGGPIAQRITKQLISKVGNQPATRTVMEHTADTIAKVRASSECKEGVKAFFDKTNTSWHRESER